MTPRGSDDHAADTPTQPSEREAATSPVPIRPAGPPAAPGTPRAGVTFVNCGSVGKPKDGDPRGAFAVLEGDDGRVWARIQRVGYDAQAVAQEVATVGLPPEYGEMLVVGG